MFFAETTTTLSGKASVRWVTSLAVAVKQDVNDVEKMVKTPGEWRSTVGLKFHGGAASMHATHGPANFIGRRYDRTSTLLIRTTYYFAIHQLQTIWKNQ